MKNTNKCCYKDTPPLREFKYYTFMWAIAIEGYKEKEKEIGVRYIVPPPDNNVADHQSPDWPLWFCSTQINKVGENRIGRGTTKRKQIYTKLEVQGSAEPGRILKFRIDNFSWFFTWMGWENILWVNACNFVSTWGSRCQSERGKFNEPRFKLSRPRK